MLGVLYKHHGGLDKSMRICPGGNVRVHNACGLESRTAQKACFGRKTSLFVVVVTDRKLPGLAQHTQPVNHGTTARRLLSDHIRRCFRSALLCAITGPSFLWLLCRPMQRRTFQTDARTMTYMFRFSWNYDVEYCRKLGAWRIFGNHLWSTAQ